MRVIGIGIDITDLSRIERMLQRHGESFVTRVFTEAEIRYCDKKKQRLQHFAGRWAAKEALLKAIGTGWIAGITWRDIEIVNDATGKPEITLSGGALQRAETLGITEIQLSISHCDCHATAFVIATGKE